MSIETIVYSSDTLVKKIGMIHTHTKKPELNKYDNKREREKNKRKMITIDEKERERESRLAIEED